MKKKEVLIRGIPYLAINLFLFIFFLLNFLSLNDFLGNHLTYLQNNFGIENAFFLLFVIIYFTYPFAFLLILISGLYLYRLKIKKSIKFGTAGTIIYGITVFYFTIVFAQNRELQLLLLIIVWMISLTVNFIVFMLLGAEKKELTIEAVMIIKKIVLDLGMKYTRLEVREISEKCGYDSDSIIEVLDRMIINKEIYAEFFKQSNTVSFDQQANIDEIDQLMAMYKDWEDEHYEKREN